MVGGLGCVRVVEAFEIHYPHEDDTSDGHSGGTDADIEPAAEPEPQTSAGRCEAAWAAPVANPHGMPGYDAALDAYWRIC